MKDSGNGYEMEFTPANRTDSETIFLPDDAIAKMEGDGPIEKDLLARLVNCNPRQARIELSETDDETADFVAVKQEITGGKIKNFGLNKKLERITLESGEIIQVQQYTTIIKDDNTAWFGALEEGDVITVFGLEDCEGNKNGIDFYGFVIIVEDTDDCYDDCDGDDEDQCEKGLKVQLLEMRYTGEDCSASDNDQDPKKTSCEGDPDSESKVFVRASDKENSDDKKAKVWFEGIVERNHTFDIDATNAGEDYLKSNTWIHIYDPKDGDDEDDDDDNDRRHKHGDDDRKYLQKVNFHTSCSQPLAVGDQFGSLVLEDMELVSDSK